MKTATNTTREQIVGVARELIQTRSYLGFSFQDVADRVGIRKASLYHHFPTKESLGIEVLQQSTAQFLAWFDTTPVLPRDKLQAYFLVYRNALHAGSRVCPAGALAAGWDCINDDLRQAACSLRQVQVDWLQAVLTGLDPKHGNTTAVLAAYIFTVCQGALLTARMSGEIADFDAAMAQLQAQLPR
ncbi:TetR/AcrR family transcriptional regulator [Chitinimonas naiadis]